MRINTRLIERIHKTLFYLLLLFLPVQLGRHFWPVWSMVMGRRVDYLAPTLYLTDLLIIVLLFFWFIGLRNRYMNYVLRISDKTLIHNTSTIILIFIFVACNITASVNKMVALYSWFKVLEFFSLGLYIVKTKQNIALISFFLSLSVLYSSVLAIVQFILQHSVGGIVWWLGERTFADISPGIARVDFHFELFRFPFSFFHLRPYATFPHPNVLGGYLAILLPGIIQSASRRINNPIRQPADQSSNRKQKIIRILYFLSIVLGTITLILTFSRSAWVAGIIGICSMNYVLWKEKMIKRFPVIYNTIPIILLILLLLFSVHANDESVVVRSQLNASSLAMWRQYPLFGVGLGNFLVRLPDFLPSRTIFFLQPVHHVYLLFLAETGITGAAFLIWAIWLFIKNHGLCIMNYGKKIHFPKIIILISLITILLIGLVDHYPLTLQQGRLLLTVVIALSVMN